MSKSTFRSAIDELEEAVFTTGFPTDAATFEESTDTITRYVTRKLSGGVHLAKAIRDGALPSLDPPKKPKKGDKEDADDFECRVLIWQEELKEAVRKRRDVTEGNNKLFGLFLSQCEPRLRTKLKGMKGFQLATDAQDGIALHGLIRAVMCGVEEHLQDTWVMAKADRALFSFWQRPGVSTDEYATQFDAFVTVIDKIGGTIPLHPHLLKKKLREAGHDEGYATKPESSAYQAAAAEVREEYLACQLLMGANRERYESLRMKIKDDMIGNMDTYPKTREAALLRINNWNGPLMGFGRSAAPANEREHGLAFAQTGDSGGGDKKTNKNGESNCFHCGKDDHWVADCPDLTPEEKKELEKDTEKRSKLRKEGKLHAQIALKPASGDVEVGVVMLGRERKGMKKGRKKKVMLDGGSTFNQAVDPELLDEIREVNTTLVAHCNAGVTSTNKVGIFRGLAGMDVEMWLNTEGIASVFSIPALKRQGFRITYDSDDGFYTVSDRRGASVRFVEDEDGLPCIEVETAVAFVQTVRNNFEGFTKREVEKAKLARLAAGRLGHPSARDMEYLVSNKSLSDMPFDLKALRDADTLFGPNIAAVRGKTVRQAPRHVATDFVAIPRDFVLMHKSVTLVADVMFVNNVPMLVTLSRGIKFRTTEHVPRRTAKQLSKSLKRVIRLYNRGGFAVQTILMDMEFDKVAPHLEGDVVVNTSAAREHVAEIEREIRTEKERARCVSSTLPFKRLHKLVVINLVQFATMWLNAFPSKSGISSKYSPREIVHRTKLSWEKHCQLDFGTYCEVHDEKDPTNDNVPRSHEGIALGPTGNFNGTYKFFCLKTGRVLKRRRWTEYPMPDRVVKKMEWWGKQTRRELYPGGIEYKNRKNEPFEWTYEDDLDGLVEEVAEAPLPDVPAEFPGVLLESDLEGPVDAVEEEPENAEAAMEAAAANAGLTNATAADILAGADLPPPPPPTTTTKASGPLPVLPLPPFPRPTTTLTPTSRRWNCLHQSRRM